MTISDCSFTVIDDNESLASETGKMEAGRSSKNEPDESMTVCALLVGLVCGLAVGILIGYIAAIEEGVKAALQNGTVTTTNDNADLFGNLGALNNTPPSVIQSLQEVKDSVALAKNDIIQSVQEVNCNQERVTGKRPNNNRDEANADKELFLDLEQNWREIAIVAFMRSQPRNLEAQKYATQMLWQKLAQTEADANLLINAGAAEATFDAMKFYGDDATIQFNGLRFVGMSTYFSASAAGAGKLVSLDAVGLIVRAMELFPEDKNIQFEGCLGIGNLSYRSKDAVTALLATAGIPVTVMAMTNFLEESPEIQGQCSWVFRNTLKQDEGNIDALVKAGAVAAVEAAALKHENNTDVIRNRDYIVSVRDTKTS